MKNFRYFICYSLLCLLFCAGVSFAEEAKGGCSSQGTGDTVTEEVKYECCPKEPEDKKCIWSIQGECLDFKMWGGFTHSNDVSDKKEGIVGREIPTLPQEHTSNNWDINLGFQGVKLYSMPFFRNLYFLRGIEDDKGIFEQLEFDAYITYDKGYEYVDLLKDDQIKERTGFKRNVAVRFKVPLF